MECDFATQPSWQSTQQLIDLVSQLILDTGCIQAIFLVILKSRRRVTPQMIKNFAFCRDPFVFLYNPLVPKPFLLNTSLACIVLHNRSKIPQKWFMIKNDCYGSDNTPPVSSTGVQRKTKMYMQDSRRDWQQPRRRTWNLKMFYVSFIHSLIKRCYFQTGIHHHHLIIKLIR